MPVENGVPILVESPRLSLRMKRAQLYRDDRVDVGDEEAPYPVVIEPVLPAPFPVQVAKGLCDDEPPVGRILESSVAPSTRNLNGHRSVVLQDPPALVEECEEKVLPYEVVVAVR